MIKLEGNLSHEQMVDLIESMMSGTMTEESIIEALTFLHEKGETTEEVAAAASVLRNKMTPIATPGKVIDIVGTGGDCSGTFNISTCSAIVTAACGVPVAKHGNRSVSSKSGASDVLAMLGVNIHADLPTVEKTLREMGLCFCFAPLYHQAMKHVGPARQKLGKPTIFNILGPLANPAKAPFQMIGAGKPQQRNLLAGVAARLGTERTLVVHGTDGIDEVSLSAPTEVTLVENNTLTELIWTPEDFGLKTLTLDTLQVSGPEESAEVIGSILANEPGPAADIVAANCAAALFTFRQVETLLDGVAMAQEAIASGKAKTTLEQLVTMTQE